MSKSNEGHLGTQAKLARLPKNTHLTRETQPAQQSKTNKTHSRGMRSQLSHRVEVKPAHSHKDSGRELHAAGGVRYPAKPAYLNAHDTRAIRRRSWLQVSLKMHVVSIFLEEARTSACNQKQQRTEEFDEKMQQQRSNFATKMMHGASTTQFFRSAQNV